MPSENEGRYKGPELPSSALPLQILFILNSPLYEVILPTDAEWNVQTGYVSRPERR